MASLIEQIKRRRISLGWKQHDMLLLVGMSRQQYQRLESQGNPRLDTLELIAQGLHSELMLIPKEKLQAVKVILENDESIAPARENVPIPENDPLIDDPWENLLKGEEK